MSSDLRSWDFIRPATSLVCRPCSDSMRGSMWRRLLVLLALALFTAACGGGDKKPGDDVVDTTDTPDTPDTTDVSDTVDTDAADLSDADTVDTNTDMVVVPQPTPGEIVTQVEGALGVELLDAIVADINGDSFLDLVGLTTTDIVLTRFDPSGGLYPPFAWEAPVTIAHNTTGTHIRAGHFDGDTATDVVVYDADAGGVRVFLQNTAAP